MAATQIDLDDELVAEAAVILGTKTKKATVNEALRRVVAIEKQLSYFNRLQAGGLPDLSDPEVMAGAWR